MEQFRLAVKEKGRTTLPAGLQRACGFAPGADLHARPLGPGRFIVESSDAVMGRIWSRLPSESNGQAVEDLAEWRATTGSVRQAHLEGTDNPEEGSDTRQEALLEFLGL
jgi:bifunctional DNA-binding transcriptional regulator/antitoxin component of YhaV-PrlF toxin-antitoxin module